MEAEIHSNGFCYHLNFKGGKPVGDMIKEPYNKKDTGTRIKWRPDLKVFTDINIPLEYFQDMMRRQAIVNAGVKFVLKNQNGSKFDTFEYFYENGIADPCPRGRRLKRTFFHLHMERRARRPRQSGSADYTLKINAAALLLEQSSAQGVLSQLELP